MLPDGTGEGKDRRKSAIRLDAETIDTPGDTDLNVKEISIMGAGQVGWAISGIRLSKHGRRAYRIDVISGGIIACGVGHIEVPRRVDDPTHGCAPVRL